MDAGPRNATLTHGRVYRGRVAHIVRDGAALCTGRLIVGAPRADAGACILCARETHRRDRFVHPRLVYVLHFDRPYRHARHYVGSTECLDVRLLEHAAGQGSRLCQVVRAAGIGWTVARVFVGDRNAERRRKRSGSASRYCPLCRAERQTAA